MRFVSILLIALAGAGAFGLGLLALPAPRKLIGALFLMVLLLAFGSGLYERLTRPIIDLETGRMVHSVSSTIAA